MVRDLVPVLSAMDLRIVAVAEGTATVEIPAQPNLNHAGVVYAGSLFSLAEVLGGIIPIVTFDLPGFVPLVRDVQIHFLRPAHGAVRATAELTPDEVARVQDVAREHGKAEFTLDVELRTEDGTVAATTRSVYQMRRMV